MATMKEMMDHYSCCMAIQDWAGAHEKLLYMASCSYTPARIALAGLYRDCDQLGIPARERYIKSEKLYRSVMNYVEDPKTEGKICLELAQLLNYRQRVVGNLAMLLRAKRCGVEVPEADITRAHRHLKELDIREFGKSARDAYDLAVELSLAGGSERLTELLLREAVDASQGLLRGQAALALAEFYDKKRSQSNVFAEEADRCFAIAARAGYPECLSRV